MQDICRSKIHYVLTQQTLDIEPMLAQCWADVVQLVPTLVQCLLFAGKVLYGINFLQSVL